MLWFSLITVCWWHVFFQYQNCLRKFFYNTDSQIVLYLARTHYEAEQWQDCKKTLLRAIHLAPSNYTLRFDAGVVMQKFSALTLQKEKKTADEVWKNLTIQIFLAVYIHTHTIKHQFFQIFTRTFCLFWLYFFTIEHNIFGVLLS